MATPADVADNRRRRREILTAGVSVFTLFLVSAGVAFAAFSEPRATSTGLGPANDRPFFSLVGSILARNFPAAVFLFSGLLAAGITSLVGIALIGSFVGATTAAASSSVGLFQVLSSVAAYAPIEFAGFAIAGASGVLPTIAAMSSRLGARASRRPGFLTTYVSTFGSSLRLWAVGMSILALASLVEAATICAR